MATISHDVAHVPSAELLKLGEEVLVSQNVPRVDAHYVSWHLVETNLRGTDSHGIARLPHYVRRIQGGSINPRPQVKFERVAASTGLLDGDHGLGHLVMSQAAAEVAKLARETGAGWVAVRNSSHCGALAPLGLKLADQGLIGLVFTHVDPMVLPYGSSQPFCGTNPICIVAPGLNGTSLCLDMATSIIPWNLVMNAANEGVAIPRGWAVDEKGADTTEPKKVAALYPFGQHKGSGLGLMIDALCSLLSGAPFGPNIPKMYGDLTQHRELGGLVGAINIDSFPTALNFRERASEMMKQLASLTAAPGFDKVRYPGEVEVETREKRLKTGIPVGLQTLVDLNELAESVGVKPLQAA